ncbi:PQQ-binding-like beta-propeller repeat protein [Nocardioides acrostichi]|uniref:PQQ-binding-like beta-propeller repeat protein n=1 Tax=Nocardioides acrostichi TaxID=2784339 RepID=A0A930Y715_9ACTN|nr:PQQ-binding-like beta-propeller repeat protein [Nocardioides acrostichi]MBF4162950.1 PQQ-binding-like beta-propeller repeat protein [Nocardioides acrostichi]
MSARGWRAAVALSGTLGALALAGCTGSSDDPDAPAPTSGSSATTPSGPSLPDPTSVATEGSIADPMAAAVWLLRATGTASDADYDARSQAVFVDGDVAVYATQDTVLGVSTTDGSTIWQSPVDMGGEVISAAAPRATSEHTWTFGYTNRQLPDDLGDPDPTGDHIVTLDITTGDVLRDTVVDGFLSLENIVMLGDTVYYLGSGGIYEVEADGLVHVRPLVRSKALEKGGAYPASIATSPSNDHVIVAYLRSSERAGEALVGIDVETRKILWRRQLQDFMAPGHLQQYSDGSALDARWVVIREWSGAPDYETWNRISTIDVETGKTLIDGGRIGQSFRTRDQRLHQPQIDTDDTYDSGSTTIMQQVPGSDTDVLVEDIDGITRVNTETGRLRWTSNTSGAYLDRGGRLTWTQGPLLPDGEHVLAALTSGVSGDLGVIDLEDGSLVGRWHLDDEFASGLLKRPLMVLDGDAVLLARNQAEQGSMTRYNGKTQKTKGKINDLGWFSLAS